LRRLEILEWGRQQQQAVRCGGGERDRNTGELESWREGVFEIYKWVGKRGRR